MSAEQLSREEVVAFLDGQPDTPEDLEALTGGAWSSAWAYRAGGEELVVRFGPEMAWYEADRMAMAFGGPDLPVPEIKKVGTTPSGRAYAISVRHHGRFLEDTAVEQAGAITPTLTRLPLTGDVRPRVYGPVIVHPSDGRCPPPAFRSVDGTGQSSQGAENAASNPKAVCRLPADSTSGAIMKRIRTSRPRIRRERPWPEDLLTDPRDRDVVRAKALTRARLADSSRTNRAH